MMIFLESPWPILLVGIAAEAVLAILLLRTGQGRWLGAMLAAGLLVLLGLLTEHFVVTDRKAISNTLDAAAAAVEANDVKGLLECVSPSAGEIRNGAHQVFERFEFRKARIHSLEITINRLTSPPTATVNFQAIGNAKDRLGQYPYSGFAESVSVTLRHEQGRWLLADYSVGGRKLP
jgi:hypothetical protein